MRAIIYSRISDDPRGKAAGVERQADECQALAAARGIAVAEVIVDNDTSATNGKRRSGFDRVLELVAAGLVDTIIVWHTDRLYRLPRDLEPLIALAETHRLKFLTVTASEIDLNTPSGRMVARMLAAASAQEVEHKAERQRSESDQRAARGAPTSRPGYGYQREGDRVVAVPEEAAVLREAAERVLAGESMRAVAADFESRGIPSPSGKPWQGTAVQRTLSRPSLAGLRVHRGQIVGDANGDVILDRSTWERLSALFADPTRAPARLGRGPRHLLSGVARCGRCADEVVYRAPGWTPKPDSRTKKERFPGYTCKVCGIRRRQDLVDEVVTETILRRLERPDAAQLFLRRDDGAAADARGELAAIDARLAMAADSFAEGDIDGTQLARITARLRGKREEFEAALRRAMPPALPVEVLGPRARETWAGLDIERQRALVRALVEVTILPVGAGRRIFDPATVQIAWREDA